MNYKSKKGISLQKRNDREESEGNWVSEIIITGGKKRSRSFSISKYGYDKALTLAFFQRLIFEVDENKRSCDYDMFCYELLEDICKFYDYDVLKQLDDKIIVTNGDTKSEYYNVEEALIDWYETLVESDKCSVEEKVNLYWEHEREFIKTLKKKTNVQKN